MIERVQSFFDANGDGDGRFARVKEKVSEKVAERY